MNKTEFIKLLAQKMDTTAVKADKSLKIVFETIGDAIAKVATSGMDNNTRMVLKNLKKIRQSLVAFIAKWGDM